jgi:hypothetical protein
MMPWDTAIFGPACRYCGWPLTTHASHTATLDATGEKLLTSCTVRYQQPRYLGTLTALPEAKP